MSASLVLAIWLALPAQSRAAGDTCGDRWIHGGTVFALDIRRAFHPHVLFKLCAREDQTKNFLLVGLEPARKPRQMTFRELPLSSELYSKINALYESALGYNVKDDAMGLDGSEWCLETKRGFTYSKVCFWTPTDRGKERGISGLLVLGQELWRLAAMDKPAGELY